MAYGSAYVATVLTACGIETHKCHHLLQCLIVATVLTACGIETCIDANKTVANTTMSCNSTYRLRY